MENFIFNDSTYSLSQINNLNIQNNTPSVDVPSYSNSGVIIDADYSIDLMNVNFNRIYKASYDFANTYQTQSWTISRNETADWGQTYNYAIGLVQKSGSNLLGALFGGDYVNYSVASNGDLIINSGNLQAFGEVFLDAYGNSTNWYSVRNFDYNGKSIFDAMKSSSTTDDKKIMESVLSGSDTFNLSNENDKVYGYAGNDLFNVGYGNDTIDGGSGTDLVRVQSSSSDYNISYSGGQLRLTKSGDTKYLKNIEYVEFADGAFATSQFQLGKISNVYDAQDGSINIYKTKSGSYVMDRVGLAVDGFTSDDAGIFYASNGSTYHRFSSDPKALDWYGDINVFRGSGNSWNKDIFQTDFNTGHYKYYKTEKLSLTELLAYETERRKDINKDGAIGDKVSDVLSNNSSKGFYKLASGPYIIDNNGLNIGSTPQSSIIPI